MRQEEDGIRFTCSIEGDTLKGMIHLFDYFEREHPYNIESSRDQTHYEITDKSANVLGEMTISLTGDVILKGYAEELRAAAKEYEPPAPKPLTILRVFDKHNKYFEEEYHMDMRLKVNRIDAVCERIRPEAIRAGMSMEKFAQYTELEEIYVEEGIQALRRKIDENGDESDPFENDI